jgi:hypothetical protein
MPIDSSVAELLTAQLFVLVQEAPDPIYFYINSTGIAVSRGRTSTAAAAALRHQPGRYAGAARRRGQAARPGGAARRRAAPAAASAAAGASRREESLTAAAAPGLQKTTTKYGNEHEAIAVYNMMRGVSKFCPIYTLCVGNAFGEAALLLSAGTKVRGARGSGRAGPGDLVARLAWWRFARSGLVACCLLPAQATPQRVQGLQGRAPS